jgi:hypothetical protein
MGLQDILFPQKPEETPETERPYHGKHGIDVLDIVRVDSESVTPQTVGKQTFANVQLAPYELDAEPCSITDADTAEDFAERMASDVKNGVRKLRAAAKVRMAEAELQTGMRAYQAIDANAALLKAKANGRLATHLLKQRQDWAKLGHGVERQVVTSDRQVDNIRYRYLGA